MPWIRSVLLLLSAVSFATVAEADNAPSEMTPAAKAFIADLERSSSPAALAPILTTRYTDDFLRPLPDIDFADDSLLARLSKLRKVSFLTLLDREDTRLFVGVNDEGIVGLHFSAYRQ